MKIKTMKTRNGGEIGVVSAKYFLSTDGTDLFCNHTSMIRNDTIYTCVDYIAKIVASLTIKQFQYRDTGGKTSIYDGITRILNDVPNEYQTRYTFIYELVSNLFIYGESFAMTTSQKITVDGNRQSGLGAIYNVEGVGKSGDNYIVGNQVISPSDILHFQMSTLEITLATLVSDIVNNLKLADETKSVFYSGAYMPHLIFKMNSESDIWDVENEKELNEENMPIITETRVEKIINRFFKPKKGNPMLIPSDKFEIEQIKPLSMKDILLHESIQFDKERIASIIGVPNYVVGEGEFKQDEFEHFVATTIMPICIMIEKEMTRKILLSSMRAFSFNVNSLLRGKPQERMAIYQGMSQMKAITVNEVREGEGYDWIEGGDEIIVIGGGVAETLTSVSDKGGGINE